MNTKKIVALAGLAAKLNHLEFITELSVSERDAGRSSMENNRKHIHCWGKRTWVAWIGLGGGQYTLASVPAESLDAGLKVARFADMAQMYFWKYKLRRRRPPKAGELNFSCNRALEDLKTETVIVDLLRAQEKVFLANGIISAEGPVEKEQRSRSKTLDAVSQASQRIIHIEAHLTRQDSDAKKSNNLIAESINRTTHILTVFDERLNGQLQLLGELSKRLDAVGAELRCLSAQQPANQVRYADQQLGEKCFEPQAPNSLGSVLKIEQ